MIFSYEYKNINMGLTKKQLLEVIKIMKHTIEDLHSHRKSINIATYYYKHFLSCEKDLIKRAEEYVEKRDEDLYELAMETVSDYKKQIETLEDEVMRRGGKL